MDNPEKLAILGTKDNRRKTNKTKNTPQKTKKVRNKKISSGLL
jgi:hypothetical protein